MVKHESSLIRNFITCCLPSYPEFVYFGKTENKYFHEKIVKFCNLEFVHTFNFQTSEKMFKMNTTVESASAVAKLSNQLKLFGLGDS